MANYDLDTIKALQERGIPLTIELNSGFARTMYIQMTPEQALVYLDKGRDFALSLIDVSPEEYEEWIRLDGSARCMEHTRSGKLCANSVATQCSLKEWQELHRNAYCHVHGE